MKQTLPEMKSLISAICVLLCLFLMILSVRMISHKRTASSSGELQLSNEDIFVAVNDGDSNTQYFRFNAVLILDTDYPDYDDYLEKLESEREVLLATIVDMLRTYGYEQLHSDATAIKQELSEKIISSHEADGFIRAVEFNPFQ